MSQKNRKKTRAKKEGRVKTKDDKKTNQKGENAIKH
jgi:hypothetical protein